jgi:hypothetical protein
VMANAALRKDKQDRTGASLARRLSGLQAQYIRQRQPERAQCADLQQTATTEARRMLANQVRFGSIGSHR